MTDTPPDTLPNAMAEQEQNNINTFNGPELKITDDQRLFFHKTAASYINSMTDIFNNKKVDNSLLGPIGIIIAKSIISDILIKDGDISMLLKTPIKIFEILKTNFFNLPEVQTLVQVNISDNLNIQNYIINENLPNKFSITSMYQPGVNALLNFSYKNTSYLYNPKVPMLFPPSYAVGIDLGNTCGYNNHSMLSFVLKKDKTYPFIGDAMYNMLSLFKDYVVVLDNGNNSNSYKVSSPKTRIILLKNLTKTFKITNRYKFPIYIFVINSDVELSVDVACNKLMRKTKKKETSIVKTEPSKISFIDFPSKWKTYIISSGLISIIFIIIIIVWIIPAKKKLNFKSSKK